MRSQQWIKSVNLSRNWTQLTYFASLSLKAGELKPFLREDEILELPRRQNRSKMFAVVPTTQNSSTTHRSRRTTWEKRTVTWFWSCAVACLTVVVVCSRRILNSLLSRRRRNKTIAALRVPDAHQMCCVMIRWEILAITLAIPQVFKYQQPN